MPAQEKHDLFEFMLDRVKDTQKDHLDGEPQAFGRWFANLFFMNPRDISTRPERKNQISSTV